MKTIISTTDRPHKDILKDYIHLYKSGDKVKVTNNQISKILTV